MKANEFVRKYGLDEATAFLSLNSNVEIVYTASFLDDLKRLVESHEMVASRGGLDAVKHELITLQKHINNTLGWVTVITAEKIDRLKQAIADVESCMEVSSESN